MAPLLAGKEQRGIPPAPSAGTYITTLSYTAHRDDADSQIYLEAVSPKAPEFQTLLLLRSIIVIIYDNRSKP